MGWPDPFENWNNRASFPFRISCCWNRIKTKAWWNKLIPFLIFNLIEPQFKCAVS
jgi:hypothetical protein